MAQESRLSIIIDSGDAERRIAALRQQLRDLGVMQTTHLGVPMIMIAGSETQGVILTT